MSKKHFVAIAKVLAQGGSVESIAKALAEVFQRENPAFDRAKFLKACGVRGA